MKKNIIILILSFIFWVGIPVILKGSEELYMSYLRGAQISRNKTMNIALPKNDLPYWKIQSSHIHAKLYLAEDREELHNTETYSVRYEITLNYGTGGKDVYTDELQVTYRVNGIYQDIDLRKYGNQVYTSASLKILEVLGTTPDDLILELQINTYRVEDMRITLAPTSVTGVAGRSSRELLITWDYYAGYESYDVEWLFIDNPSHRDNIPFDFKNATRVNTSQNYYVVPLAYPKGSVLFRVRGIYIPTTTNLYTGFWSHAAGSGTSLPQPGPEIRYDYDGLEQDMSWQYTGMFAEEGKRSEAITFFDGTLRDRQQVVFGNDPEIARITETFYDHMGRPALKSLPVPTSGTGMHYYGTGGSSNGQFNGPMEKSQYDTDDKIGNPDPFPERGGWSRYYSPANSFLNRLYAVNVAQVPADQGYVYSHIRYRNDGTDRIHSVSAPGQDFALGSGHETRYYYGNPTQSELDRLFGNEVGDASHYQKVITVDANDMTTIEYYDMQERLIATSLGTGGDNLLPIDGAPEPRRFSETIYYDEESREDNRTILVSANGTYTFEYYFNPASRICEFCQVKQVCLECYYKIVVSLWDPDKMKYIFYQTDIVNGEKKYFFEATLGIGNYLLHKEVAIYDGNLEGMLDNYRAVMDQCAPYIPVQPAPCYTICEEYCMQTLNYSEPDYSKKEFTDCMEQCENPPVTYQTQCEAWYESMLRDMSPGGQYFDNITYRCPPDSLENVYDFSGRNNFLNRISTSSLSNDPWIRSMLSLFGIPSSDPDRYNRLWDSLRNNWDEQYSLQMFAYHPERSIYELKCACGDTSLQNGFDNLMMNITSFKEADGYGLLNPLGMNLNPGGSITNDPDKEGYQPFKPGLMDPYFEAGVKKCCEKSAAEMREYIMDRMKNYLTWEQNNRKYFASVWYLLFDPDRISVGSGPSVLFDVREAFISMQEGILPEIAEQYSCSKDDARWILFRNIYLYLKEETKATFFTNCYNEYALYKEPLAKDQREWHTGDYPEDALESCKYYLYADPACRNRPLTMEGFEIRFLCNPAYGLNRDNAQEMLNISVTELTENCMDECEAYANQWMLELRDYLAESCDIKEQDSRWQDIKDELIKLCQKVGCMESAYKMDFTRRQLFEERSFRWIFESIGCDMNGKYILPMIVFPKEDNFLDCGCNNFQEFLNTAGLTFASDREAISKALEEENIKTDVDYWKKFCMFTRYNYLLENYNDTIVWVEYDFPARFRCTPADEDWLAQCKKKNELEAASLNTRAKEEALDVMVETKRGLYPDHCLDNIQLDQMIINYQNEEYLFTLYYYDQAGNLIRTVPPLGVALIENESMLEAVRRYRRTVDSYENMAGFVHPAHTMSTNYRYNTLDQVITSYLPDHDAETDIYYDILSRPVLSSNPKQKSSSTYTYTLYDDQGRITETGQVANTAPVDQKLAADPQALAAFILNGQRTEITRTTYDIPLVPNLGQSNLRNRIAALSYYEQDGSAIQSASHYSYDFHGNVGTFIRQIPDFSGFGKEMITMDYEYDLISGNVNKFWYEKGKDDQFIHRYRYDADNRLTHVLTSQDNQIWHHDARYFYLPHGPLARTELGEKQIQGLDYAYTIRGWLKAMNSYQRDPQRDIGQDGNQALTGNSTFANDAFGYTLQYYANDYKPVRQGSSLFWLDYHEPGRDLYNGNISGMSTHARPSSIMKAFRYDKLNRIMFMETATLAGNDTWSPLSQQYKTIYRYDFNGNLVYLHRLDDGAYDLHQIQYYYQPRTNRLNNIQAYGIGSSVYQYDATGNLVYDENEKMTIEWNASGKVRSVKKANGAELTFRYTALGEREVKKSQGRNGGNQYNIHDPNGNIIATYGLTANRLIVVEQSIYGGSGRLGIFQKTILRREEETFASPQPSENYTRRLGHRQYELTDHLGNVHATFLDRKLEKGVTNGEMGYSPEMYFYTDYYPFGFPMPKRFGRTLYRYGFNGQEKDNEIYGEGQAYTAEFWQYDARLGRRWNVDPEIKPWQSSYVALSNNPILMIDPFGDDDIFNKKGEFIKRTNTVTNNILIMDQNGKTSLLSQTKLDQKALRNVGKHYAAQISDIAKNVNIWGLEDNSIMTTRGYGGINENNYLAIFISQGISPSVRSGLTSPEIDNYNDFQNTLIHEWWHYSQQYAQEKNGLWSRIGPQDQNIRELDAYEYQISHKTWKNTSRSHQIRTISNIGTYLYKIKDQDLRNEKIKYFEDTLKIKFTNLSNKTSQIGWKLNLNNESDN